MKSFMKSFMKSLFKTTLSLTNSGWHGMSIKKYVRSFFQRLIGIVVELVRVFVIFGLHNHFLNHIVTQITQCLFYHRRHTTPDRFHLYQVIGVPLTPLREQHNVHLCLFEELVGTLGKHHGRHVLDAPTLRHRLQSLNGVNTEYMLSLFFMVIKSYDAIQRPK